MNAGELKKKIAVRRAVNQRLGQQDQASRCAYCRAAVIGGLVDFISGLKFCDDDCQKALAERQAMEASR